MRHSAFILTCALCSCMATQAHAHVSLPPSVEQEEMVSNAQTNPLSSAVGDASQAQTQSMPAQSNATGFKPTLNLGGCIITQYSYSDREDKASDGGFNVRVVRAVAHGKVWNDVGYRLQLELSGAPGIDRGARVLDAYAEWTRFAEWQPRLGQFKRCFGFENPIHPMNVGMGSFSQMTQRLQSINDRIGEHVSNGRDIGFQMQGDFLPQTDGHRLLHYQVGVYNGQGTNHVDVDKHKDLIGGLWVMPTKELRIGAFGWDGYYTNEKNPTETLRRVRYDLGFTYEGAVSARAEYAHSVGGTTRGGATRSDGWYAMLGVPVPQCENLKFYGRWDCYRDDATRWDGLVTNWGLTANYYLGKNYDFQVNYTHTVDRNLSLRAGHYNTIDVQVCAKF